MADLIPYGLIQSTGRRAKAQAGDDLVGVDGTSLLPSRTFFFGRTALTNSPMRWTSSVINSGGFILTSSSSLIEVPSNGIYLIIVKANAPFGTGVTLQLRRNGTVVCSSAANAGPGGNVTNVCMHVQGVTNPATERFDVVSGAVDANVLANSILVMKLS